MSRQPAPARRTKRRRTLVLASAAAVFLGAIVLVRYASAPVEDAVAFEEPDRLEQAADAATNAEPVAPTPAQETMQFASAGIAAPPVVEERHTAPVIKARPKKVATVSSAKSRVAASAKSTAPIAPPAMANVTRKGDAAATTAQAPPVSNESVGPAPVTLTGCLEISVDRDAFRLSDPDGVDAPRARSWRTGFLTKRPTPVSLVEPPDPHGLQVQVGRRVVVTGLLTDRELKVSTVRVVGPSCD
jgi:hypothetical protein